MKIQRKFKIKDNKYNEFDKFNIDKHNIRLISTEENKVKEIELILYDKNGKIYIQKNYKGKIIDIKF